LERREASLKASHLKSEGLRRRLEASKSIEDDYKREIVALTKAFNES
jgi:hypothetical protein